MDKIIQLPLPEPQAPPRVLLLMTKPHLSFEAWFVNLFLTGQLSEEENFRIIDLRSEYLNRCFSEEIQFEKWSKSNGNQETE